MHIRLHKGDLFRVVVAKMVTGSNEDQTYIMKSMKDPNDLTLPTLLKNGDTIVAELYPWNNVPNGAVNPGIYLPDTYVTVTEEFYEKVVEKDVVFDDLGNLYVPVKN